MLTRALHSVHITLPLMRTRIFSEQVTRVMVKEARVAEIRQELVNSARLGAHFKEHPDDLKVTKHVQQLIMNVVQY